MFRIEGHGQTYEDLEDALLACEIGGFDARVLHNVYDVVAVYRRGSGVEWPPGVLSIAESAQLAAIRRNR